MNQSPWMANNQGAYEVPGLAALLLQRNRDNQEAFANIGQFAGALGAGAVGAVQGNQDPGVFGAGTSPASGAAQGGLMNFANAYNGGGFSRLVNNGGGAGGGDGGTNFKQFAALGKAADGVRDAIKAATPHLPDQQPSILGMTDDEWKHAGTAAKVTALKGWQQGQTAKAQIQAYDLGQAHLKQVLDAQAQQEADLAAWARFGAKAKELTQPVPLADNPMTPSGPVQSPALQMFANAAANPQPLNGQEMMSLAMQSGVNPQDSLTLGKTAAEFARAEKQANGNDRRLEFMKSPSGASVAFSPDTGVFQFDPSYAIGLRTDAAEKLLRERMSNLSAGERVQSLDRQEKAVREDLMLSDEERAAKLATIESLRKELTSGGGKPSATGPVRRYNPATGKIE